jgi:hypothetical protein
METPLTCIFNSVHGRYFYVHYVTTHSLLAGTLLAGTSQFDGKNLWREN